MPRELLDEYAAAEYVGIGVSSLRACRLRRSLTSASGPPFIRVGLRTIRYDKADLDAWLESRRIDPAAHKAAAIATAVKGRRGALSKAREGRAAA